MTDAARNRPGWYLGGLLLLFVVATATVTQYAAQTSRGSFLGLTFGSRQVPELWEGPTNYDRFLRPKGVVRAVMLFAKFPDADAEESTQDLFIRLVPEAMDYFKRVSYGQMTLAVDARHRWIPMDAASSLGRYDCSKEKTHKAYIAEVVRKTAGEVDYAKYDIVYIVGSINKGTPNSPTYRAWPGN